MPTLSLINFNIVCATLGGFISVFGLVSYLFKERFYLSEACSWDALPSRTTNALQLVHCD